MKKGRLIVFTGIDGSGKTTQAEVLVNILKRDSLDVTYVWSRWEPFLLRPVINIWKKKKIKHTVNPGQDYKELSNKKKKLLDNPIFRWLWLTLFFIDYGIQVFSKVRTELAKRDLIVSDRNFFDSVIDQAINLGKRKDSLLNRLDSFWIKCIFPQPDMVIYVDCPADIAFTRKEDAPNVEYLMERRNLYLQLAERYGWVIVDGTLSVDKISAYVKDEVYNSLKLWKIRS